MPSVPTFPIAAILRLVDNAPDEENMRSSVPRDLLLPQLLLLLLSTLQQMIQKPSAPYGNVSLGLGVVHQSSATQSHCAVHIQKIQFIESLNFKIVFRHILHVKDFHASAG
jgi:hypothetical protein